MYLPGGVCTMSDPLLSRHAHHSQALMSLGAQGTLGHRLQQQLQQRIHLCEPLATCPYLCPPPCPNFAGAVSFRGAGHPLVFNNSSCDSIYTCVNRSLHVLIRAPRHAHNSQALFALGAQGVDGLQQLQQLLHLCEPLQDQEDVKAAAYWVQVWEGGSVDSRTGWPQLSLFRCVRKR